MCLGHSVRGKKREKTSALCWRKWSELKAVPFLSLDLTPGHGNLLGESYWELISPYRGGSLTLNTGVSPRGAVASTLSQILEANPHPRYYLSRNACLGILRRAQERGKELPLQLKTALMIQAGLIPTQVNTIRPVAFFGFDKSLNGAKDGVTAFAANQRDEVRDLHGVSAALGTQPGMKQQTFVTTPGVLCLNDQGGARMDLSEDVVGTLRAQMGGHEPLVMENSGPTELNSGDDPLLFDNHGIASRYRNPFEVASTMSAHYGTDGNNIPLVRQEEPAAYCITGNAIDRQPQNGGNGMGWQGDLAYTLTATDHHAVFSRQRVDVFLENDVVSTESARQHKDATDLVLQQTVGALTSSDRKGPNNQYVSQDKCIVVGPQLIRRLTPLECERLQGFPDFWTDIPGASDSARYKALGNSVAIPCVEYVMRGIALAAGEPVDIASFSP